MTRPRELWAPTPLQCVFLDQKEFREREAARHAAIDAWRQTHPDATPPGQPWPDELRALSDSFIPPGSMWECPWYLDPEEKTPEGVAEMIRAIEQNPDKSYYLSIHYLRDWALKRPPICCVLPDGGHWVIDSKSSNGSGWTITGEAPNLTASPSIWGSMPNGYHGWLQNGVFSAPV